MSFRNVSFIAAFASAITLGSCAKHPGEPVSRAVLYNNATNADAEGYIFFKSVHQKAEFETQLAKHVQGSSASAKAKELAGKVVAIYEPIGAELESLAEAHLVVLPDPGMPGFAVPPHFSADSLGSFDSEAYIAHVQHEQATILEQLNRADRNTDKNLRNYAKEKLPAVKELFALAGGQEDHGAHH
ncbi:DUF4142 domain-containing protein [Parapedobacter sp. DT-150]|uniref:DUF4142 domain-containing protein n=1 Tax=Parapedobacter sp. DT-150 TaxID=3396162 RepID=UPI003F1BDC7A